jgi:RNA polymerase sigma factor (sigma-70 family)
MDQSDDALIVRYLTGDVAAFEQLYHRYAGRLLGFLISMGAPRDAAEDVAQKAWIKALEALESYRGQGRFRAWLFTLSYRLWLDEARSAWRTRSFGMDEEQLAAVAANGAPRSTSSTVANPREAAEAREERELLEQALEELPDSMRQTVLLRIDGELAYREIAEMMDCPLGTVQWRMNEAQRRLSMMLMPVKEGLTP